MRALEIELKSLALPDLDEITHASIPFSRVPSKRYQQTHERRNFLFGVGNLLSDAVALFASSPRLMR